MTRKLRILARSEATYLSSGYAVYYKNLLDRLYSTNKYILAEHASYCNLSDQRIHSIPWRVYPNAPEPNDQDGINRHNADGFAQFGGWRFEDVVLDFKPDIVFDIGDTWYCSHLFSSPFRPFYKIAYMPTVDSEPQATDWIGQMAEADCLFTYTDWAKKTLEKQTNNKLVIKSANYPGGDFRTYNPIADKVGLKAQFGFGKSINIVGTVMRNQARKLFPDLFQAFRKFLNYCDFNNKELGQRTYLYCHTSYPDLGWNLPLILQEENIMHKVLFTYLCRNCRNIFVDLWSDTRVFCPHCGQPGATFPNTQQGIDPQQLNLVYNLMDLYVQVHNCLAKGSKVLLESGWTNIEDVKVGDMAYTHKNRYMPVVETFIRTPDENVLELEICSDYEKLVITEDHPLYAIKNDNNRQISLREHIGNCLRLGQEVPKPDFIKAKDLKPGDLIAFPIDDSVEDIDRIDLADYLDKDKYHITQDEVVLIYKNRIHSSHPRYITVDNDFCRFIGLFAADGCWMNTTNNSISVTQHIDEIENIQFIKNILTLISSKIPSQYFYPDRKGTDIYISSKILANVFQKLFGKHEYKQLPKWTEKLSKEKQLCILEGLLSGDGCITNTKKAKVNTYCTISHILIDQIKNILRRNRICYNVHINTREKDKDKKNRKPQYRLEIYYKDSSVTSDRHNTRNVYIDNYYYLQIKNIIKSNYNDFVYNFEVQEDNSYVSKVGAISNSEGYGIPCVEAAACGVPLAVTNYAGTIDFIEKAKAYPIDILCMSRDATTHTHRVKPDQESLVNILINFFNLPDTLRKKKGADTRKSTEKYFNWNDTTKKWMAYFDTVTPTDSSLTWKSVPRLHNPVTGYPPNLSMSQMVDWAIVNVLGCPEKLNTYFALNLVKSLTYGGKIANGANMYINDFSMIGIRPTPEPFQLNNMLQMLYDMRQNINYWERVRCNMEQREKPYYVVHAKPDQNIDNHRGFVENTQ